MRGPREFHKLKPYHLIVCLQKKVSILQGFINLHFLLTYTENALTLSSIEENILIVLLLNPD